MRSDAREAAFKLVFAELFHDGSDKPLRSAVYKKANLNEEDTAFADRLVTLVAEHKEELLNLLGEKVLRFKEYRIYPVDRAILLIALAEIKYAGDVPNVVSVNEAAGLAAKYSTENSASFVNGVLAGVINS